MSPMDHAEDRAEKMVGNWRKFDSFAWSTRHDLNDAESWCIYYTHNRDSNALDRSNAHVIAQTLDAAEFENDVRSESHSHWACGWVDGYAVRVRSADGALTPAFVALAALLDSLDEYPVLDESHFSETEQEEANEAWTNCLNDAERIEYIRNHRNQFEFHSFADMLSCVRGNYFGGYASDLLSFS